MFSLISNRYSIKGLWATPHTEKFDNDEYNDRYAKTTIRELTVYMIFIGVLTISNRKFSIKRQKKFVFSVVFGMVDNNTYSMTQALKGAFVDSTLLDKSNNKSGPSFSELNQMDEFWEVEFLDFHRDFSNLFDFD